MDYTFWLGHISGHLASVLTMVAYLLKDILWLRLLTILSCFAGIAFNYFVPATPLWTIIYWNVLFAVINIVQCAIIIRERSGIQFTDEEKELHETLFKNFAPFEFMKLMRIGNWRAAKPGQVLTVEGEPLDEGLLVYEGRLGGGTNSKGRARLADRKFIGVGRLISSGAAA